MNKNKKNSDNIFEKEILPKLSGLLDLKKTELHIYNLLRNAEKPMLVTEICKNLNASRRLIQDYVKDLTERGFLKREIQEAGRLSYVYIAEPPLKVWKHLSKNLKKVMDEANKALKINSIK